MSFLNVPGVKVIGKVEGAHSQIVTPEALAFLAVLHRNFNATRKILLKKRVVQQALFDAGGFPDFAKETAHIRDDPSWQGPFPAPGLEDRRVEITGPVDRKMVINALNSGAKTFMADFEDSNAPTWFNNVDGQLNLKDAVRRKISFTNPIGKEYKLNDKIATLLVRPRGWHLEEANVLIDGQPMSGSLFDFGMYFFHNAAELLARGSGPYFYLPKMEHSHEARLWNDVFRMSQDLLGIRRGSIRGTVLIETLPAAFQMDEIIFELREHSSGLNCGRWDYIFSFIKKMRLHPDYVLPDRGNVAMTVPFMDAYVRLLIKTCHRRGVAAMGGMSAQIPIKNDDVANKKAMDKVHADKKREVEAGHDGTWVAHPALVPIALEEFNKGMVGPNQYHNRREEVVVTAADILNANVPGSITEFGVRDNCSALLHYCGNWINGLGCVPVANMMEDAATAEISRVQLWSWRHNEAYTDQGVKITNAYLEKILAEEAILVKATGLSSEAVDISSKYLISQIRAPLVSEFLTSDLMPFLKSKDGTVAKL